MSKIFVKHQHIRMSKDKHTVRISVYSFHTSCPLVIVEEVDMWNPGQPNHESRKRRIFEHHGEGLVNYYSTIGKLAVDGYTEGWSVDG